MEDLQKKIIELYKVKKEIDPKEEARRIIDFIKDYVRANTFVKSLVLGISGGQDSTLLGKLSQIAVSELRSEGIDIVFIGVKLPYKEQLDMEDVIIAMEFIKPDIDMEVNIGRPVDEIVKALEEYFDISDFNKGNIKARVRMVVQYGIAGEKSGLVLGTDHAAENIMGFFTKHGDGAADLMPLFHLNKGQGKEILKYLGAPKKLYEKVPTADLEDDKPLIADELSVGVSYEEIDSYLTAKEVSKEAKERIESAFLKSQHKRHLPVNIFDDFWK